MAEQQRIDGPRAGVAAGLADSLVVLLHGYGADGRDLIGLAGPLAEVLPGAAFVSPDAPQACAANPTGRQWFPIPWLDGSTEVEMAQGFASAVTVLDGFLDAEMERHGLEAGRIALVGFSQGTMMALHLGFRREAELAGIIGYSGKLAVPERLAAEARSRPPVLLVHGDQDEMIPVESTHEAAAALAEAGVPVRWHISRGTGHGIAPDGLELGRNFLAGRLGMAAGGDG